MFDTKRLTWQSLVARVKQIQINLSTCTIYQVVSCSGHLLCCVLSLRQWQLRARMVHWLFQACNLPCVLVTTGTLTASSSDYRCNPWLWSGFQVPITPSMTLKIESHLLFAEASFSLDHDVEQAVGIDVITPMLSDDYHVQEVWFHFVDELLKSVSSVFCVYYII